MATGDHLTVGRFHARGPDYIAGQALLGNQAPQRSRLLPGWRRADHRKHPAPLQHPRAGRYTDSRAAGRNFELV